MDLNHLGMAQAIRTMTESAMQPDQLQDLAADVLAHDGTLSNYPIAVMNFGRILEASMALVEMLPPENPEGGN